MKTWPKVKLGEVILQIRGVSYTPQNVSETPKDNYIPILRAHNIQDDGLDFAKLVYVDSSKVSERQRLQKGDIVICASSGSKGLVGKAARFEGSGAFSFGAFCKAARPCGVNSRYLAHFFAGKSYRRKISDLSAGANINNIKNEHIDRLEIPLPPSMEQERIAAELDAVVATLKKRRTQLVELNALVESRFIELLGDPATNPKGWPKKSIKTLFDLVSRGKQPAYIENSSIAVVNQACIYNDFFKFQNLKYFDPSSSKKTLEIQEGDILVNSTGTGTLGRCNIFVPNDAKTYVIDSHVTLLRPSKVVLPLFFKTFFLAQPTQEKFYADCVSGSTNQIELSKEKFLRFEIPLPPLELQERFAAEVERIEAVKASVRDGIAETQTLFDALSQRYFD